MTDRPITETKAKACLEAVRTRWARYLAPEVIDGEEYDALYPEPTLHEPGFHTANGWSISWEEGPDEWAFLVTSGGSSESDRVMYASASAEFGVDVKAPEVKPADMPPGVFAEPINSFTLGLYRA